tara:strand:- start:884 stop:1423 length:540 start_codon:yes stop_codon:yes gene_type:complete
MAEKYKPWEAPQYMQDYAATATQPFNRSMLGQKLAMEKLEEMADNDYEQPIDKNMPETGIENAVMPEDPTLADSLLGPVIEGLNNPGFTKYWAPAAGKQAYDFVKRGFSKPGSKQVTKKLATKAGSKLLTRLAGYSVPYAGQAMMLADAVDYFGYPIYDHLPGGAGDWLTWRDTTEGEE